MMKTILLLLIGVSFLILASCTAQQAVEAGAAVAAGAAAMVKVVAPLLSPEEVAKLELIASRIDSTAEATSTAVRTIVDTIVALKTNVGAQFSEVARHAGELTANVAKLPTSADVHLASAETAAGINLVGAGALNAYRNRTRERAMTGRRGAAASSD